MQYILLVLCTTPSMQYILLVLCTTHYTQYAVYTVSAVHYTQYALQPSQLCFRNAEISSVALCKTARLQHTAVSLLGGV